jgi:hypothetical protein
MLLMPSTTGMKFTPKSYSNYALLRNPNQNHSAMGFLVLRNPEPAGQPHSL